jgi:transposase
MCTDEDTAVAARLTPGQAGDAPQFEPLLDEALARVPDAEEAVADRAYDSWAIRIRLLQDEDMPAQIPSKANAAEPWPYDEEAYKERNRVERLVGKMKQFRAVATRYDKLGDVFLTTVRLVLCFIKARSIVNTT